jgi:TetR/AcrR family transcriptional repressor of nem operon
MICSKSVAMPRNGRSATASSVGLGTVSYEKLIDDYLSAGHRDHPTTGCAFSTLAPEIARSDKRTRALTSEQVRSDIQLIAGLHPAKDKGMARSRAILAFSALVGAMSLARAVSDEALSRDILKDRGKALEDPRLEAAHFLTGVCGGTPLSR